MNAMGRLGLTVFGSTAWCGRLRRRDVTSMHKPNCGARSLEIREKALGPEHPNTARSLDNLAFLLRSQGGDNAGARPLYERALAIREKALGPEHPDTAASLTNLAFLLQVQGDLSGARPLYERAL